MPDPPNVPPARTPRRLTSDDRDRLDRISSVAFRAAARIDDRDELDAWSAIEEVRAMVARLPRR